MWVAVVVVAAQCCGPDHDRAEADPSHVDCLKEIVLAVL